MTTTHAVPPSTFDPKVPFSRADARASGIPEDALRTLQYQRIFYDAYVSSLVPVTTSVRAAAAIMKVSENAYASHQTAAQLWGIPVPDDGLVHVTAAKMTGRTRCRGILTHQPLTATARTLVCDGIRVSSPEQVFCELAAAGLGLVDLVVAGDAMLRAKKASLDTLWRAVDAMAGAGVKLARRACGYVRVGVESPMESRLRMLLVLAGLPEPRVNYILRTLDGDWGRRFDMYYPALKLIIEYDGDQHGHLDQRDSDIHRREELERLGYKIIAVTAHGIYRNPGLTLRRVAEAIRERGGHAPGRFKPEWRAHFPVRAGRDDS